MKKVLPHLVIHDDWEASRYDFLRRLFSRLQVREVLTHGSFYEKEGQGNGRYVFAGQYVFRGQVAQILYDWFGGSGTQLQHILGNLFRNERLARLFDLWHLKPLVRAGEKFDINAHKHIFVYAICGHVSQLSNEDLRNWFIFKYILNEETHYLFSHRRLNRDLLAQADSLARQVYGCRLVLQMSQSEEGLHVASAVLADGSTVCRAMSKSWRYARTKAVKTALNLIATPGRKALLADPAYQERIRKQLEDEYNAHLAQIEARLAAKEEIRRNKEEERSRLAKLRDAKRRARQAEAKKRKAENAARAAAKAAKEARPMSAKKRRHLEDKKK